VILWRIGRISNFIESPKLTRFERARIVGARALQITMGAPLLLEPGGLSNPIDMALRELYEGVLPITIRRKLPEGTYQDIPIQWLLREETTITE